MDNKKYYDGPCFLCGKTTKLSTPENRVKKKYCDDMCRDAAQNIRDMYKWCVKNNKKFSWDEIEKIAQTTKSTVDNGWER